MILHALYLGIAETPGCGVRYSEVAHPPPRVSMAGRDGNGNVQ